MVHQNDATGKVIDRRSTKGRPSYAELSRRPASELKEMWIQVRMCAPRPAWPHHHRVGVRVATRVRGAGWQAIEGQLADLRKAEGDDSPLVPVLEKELKVVRLAAVRACVALHVSLMPEVLLRR